MGFMAKNTKFCAFNFIGNINRQFMMALALRDVHVIYFINVDIV